MIRDRAVRAGRINLAVARTGALAPSAHFENREMGSHAA